MECSLENNFSEKMLDDYLISERNFSRYMWGRCSLYGGVFLSLFTLYFILRYQSQYSEVLFIFSLVLFVLSAAGLAFIKIRYKNVEIEKKKIAKKLFSEGLRVEDNTLITNEAHYKIITSKPDILS